MRCMMTMGAALLLPGCSNGPGDAAILAAVQAANPRSHILSIEGRRCVDAGEGRYRCTFRAGLERASGIEPTEASMLFEQRPSGWAIVGE